MLETKKIMEAENAMLEKKIARLEAELEKEQEWKPYVDKHNYSDEKYDQLASAGIADELTDDEAVDMIAKEFGFVRESISIICRAPVYEINRHNRLRRSGRSSSTEVRYMGLELHPFNVTTNVTRAYEMVNGELKSFMD